MKGFSTEEVARRFRWSKDQGLQYWSGNIPTAPTLDAFRRMIPDRDWPANGKRQSYGIETADHGLIGMVSCYSIDRAAGTAELGVYIGIRSLWGKGLGTDAVETLVRHMFKTGLRLIFLNTYATNTRAIVSYGKVGFTKVATHRRFRPGIGYYREVRMALDRAQYAERHRATPDVTGASAP